MRNIWLFSILILTTALAEAQTQYTITDLGTLGGTITLCGHGLNGKSQVAGGSTRPGDEVFHLFLWQRGVMRDLGTLGASTFCVGTMGMNEKTQIVGYYVYPDGPPSPFLYRPYVWSGRLFDLGTLGGAYGLAEGINDFTQIVGGSFLRGNTIIRAFFWQNGAMYPLPVSFGGRNSVAHGINYFGQVVGEAETSQITSRGFPKFVTFLWSHGIAKRLGTLGGELTAAFALNDLGDVVGVSETNDIDTTTGWPLSHAYIWRKEVMTDLGVLPGDDASHANQINNRGQVVGTSGIGINMNTFSGNTLTGIFNILPSNCSELGLPNGDCFQFNHGFLWENGVMYDLDDLVPPHSGWHFIAGDAINDRGQIVAAGFFNGGTEFRSVLLTPNEQ